MRLDSVNVHPQYCIFLHKLFYISYLNILKNPFTKVIFSKWVCNGDINYPKKSNLDGIKGHLKKQTKSRRNIKNVSVEYYLY